MTNQPDSQSIDTRPEHVRMLQDALDVPEKDTYTYSDLLDVAAAEVVKVNFSKWVVERFYEEGESGTEFEVILGRRPGQRISVERPTGGYTSWSMTPLTHPRGIEALLGQGADAEGSEAPYLRMEKYTADDRGPGMSGPVVAFPLDLLFGERKRNEEYAEYLRLKAIYETDESGAESGGGNSGRNMQALGLPDPQAGPVGPSESDRQA